MNTPHTSILAAIKGKAPIVALPVEGHAPACIDRKRLAAWAKKVTIQSVEIVRYEYLEAPRPVGAEGPALRTTVARHIEITGTSGRVKTRCRMVVIDRRTAVRTLAAWSEKERAKLQKKVLLGALSKEAKRTLKLAQHDDTGALVPVDIAQKGRAQKVRAYGAPVEITELGEYEFIVHRSVDFAGEVIAKTWSVTERSSGMSAGSGTTAEEAIAAARNNVRTASPERLAKVRAQIAELAAPAVAA